jgi:hypothetical protein
LLQPILKQSSTSNLEGLAASSSCSPSNTNLSANQANMPIPNTPKKINRRGVNRAKLKHSNTITEMDLARMHRSGSGQYDPSNFYINVDETLFKSSQPNMIIDNYKRHFIRLQKSQQAQGKLINAKILIFKPSFKQVVFYFGIKCIKRKIKKYRKSRNSTENNYKS